MRKNNGSLYTLLLKASNTRELKEILEGLVGKKQLLVLEQRYLILKHLTEGKNYVDIMKETKTSSATIAKLSRDLDQSEFIKYVKK